ncbi:alpha/beta hydrolase [Sphingomonas abietis]|uniref:Alpha/beta hydrolase n=1 Tax=Sphingomonas abietis TaxID=3012344 RepID=A0ABY7NVG5_9SPHN|nr:alpha/beta hydrolase [Sphingomonas abietis]WBO24643.1 alpha/beta hydrolase [Sphingomonas abietis]
MPGPRLHEMDAPSARAMMRAMAGVADLETGPIAVKRDLTMPGPDGPIGLRLYDRRESREPGPVVVFFHGGGWVVGDLDGYDSACAAIARGLDLPVVSVDYRLAPEHRWPAAPDDCEAAARWIAAAPAELGLTPTGLVLAGDSAGGNLTIVTALALRDTPAALPVLAQWALYPAADMVNHYPSYKNLGEGFVLTEETMRWFNDHYRPDVSHWRASPMQADFAGLPPALVTTAGLDPLRDQGRAYAAALAQAGVAVSYREAIGNVHGFLNLRRAIPSSVKDVQTSLIALKSLIEEVTA